MLGEVNGQHASLVETDPEEVQTKHSLWHKLVSGRWAVESWGHTSLHCCLRVIRRTTLPPLSSQEEGKAEYLRRTLRGGQQKVVAATEETSLSTISESCRHTLLRMGFESGVLSAPYILVHAAHTSNAAADESYSITPDPDSDTSIVRVARPDLTLPSRLSRGEQSILEMILNGYSAEFMAQQRNASMRTIANQLSAIFRKLNSSGRLGTLCILAQRQLNLQPARAPAEQEPRDRTSPSSVFFRFF